MRRIRPYILFTIAVILFGACAKIVEPVGGPKDTTPPKILKEVPANQSTNFATPQIRITMDEYFTLDNPTENVLISPPLQHQPEYKIQEKTLIVKIKDTLHTNTTYNMVFSNCIQDYHENNKLNYYHYSFSTGNCIDTFTLKGRVQDALTLAGGDDYTLMLYREDYDSLPLTTLPYYISKSQKDGSFSFQNLTPGTYKIFALKHINNNFLYDLPNESIAFSNEMVQSFADIPDSIADTSQSTPEIVLYAFTAKDTLPKLLRYENPEAGLYLFPFSAPVNGLKITPLIGNTDFFHTWSSNQDTLTMYLKETSFDSLAYVFTLQNRYDTVHLKPFKPKQPTGRGASAKPTTNYLHAALKNEGHFYKPLTIQFSYPIQPTDTSYVFLYGQGKKDSTRIAITISDTFTTEVPIPYPLDGKKKYTLMVPRNTFKGYNGLTNDTIQSTFTTQSEKDYGNIIMKYTLSDISYPLIAQLWMGNTLIQQDILQGSITINYPHVDPGTYQIRIIHDENGNGHWDTGNYHTKQQPEAIIQYGKEIRVRAFWDLEEEFKIDRNTSTK